MGLVGDVKIMGEGARVCFKGTRDRVFRFSYRKGNQNLSEIVISHTDKNARVLVSTCII